jgi:hypothetical protein
MRLRDQIDAKYLLPNLLMPIGGRFEEIAKEAIKGQGKRQQTRPSKGFV